MMKKITLSLTFALTAFAMAAQSSKPLPINDLGLICFSKVVQVEDASKETLYNNAFNYLLSLVDNHKKLKKGPYVNKDSTEVYLPLTFTVYRDFPIHSPHGLIKYQLTVSVKDNRYRYLASDFVFHYLKRNRYGRFVEVSGKSKALEEPFFKGNQQLWEQHKQAVAEKIETIAETLYAEMVLVPKEPEEEIVKINEDW